MRSTSLSVTIRLATTAAALGCALSLLTGCSGFDGATFPATSDVPTTAKIGTLNGNVYGGHAPLVGAHVYLVQPSTAGYGNQVTSIMTNDAYGAQYGPAYALYATGSFPNTPGVADQFVPSGFKGVTTNGFGQFAIAGDYTCTVGLPVILIAYGGSPSYAGAGPNAFNIQSVAVSNVGTNTATYTFTTGGSGTVTGGTFTPAANGASQQLFYPGEQVTFSLDATNGLNLQFNSPFVGTISATNLMTNSFQITYNTDTGAPGTPKSYPGTTLESASAYVQGTPVFNPAAVNMAVLGNCPPVGDFSNGPAALSYIYVNEISTVATAYAFVGFTDRGDNSGSGNDEFHLGSSNDIAQAAGGMFNAALTANMLYDIQGSNVATNNPDGDVHIARSTTPGGNGSVSQTTINTLGDILAACVDSNNTFRIDKGTGVQSPQCKALAFNAPDNGTTSTSTKHQTANIAQAAFAIARNPQIDGAAAISALFNLAGGQVPFTPTLVTAPNDWSVVIGWSAAAANGGTATSVQDVAVDSQGNVWAPTRAVGTNQVFEFTPSGTVTGYTALISPNVEQIAIDITDHAWVPGVAGNYQFIAGTTAGTLVGASAVNGGGIAIDPSTNQYVTSTSDSLTASLVKQNANATLGFNSGLATNCGRYMDFVTLDSANLSWTATANPATAASAYICRYTAAGAQKLAYNIPGSSFPHYLATDMSDNLWFAEKNAGGIYSIAAGATSASGVSSLATPTSVAATGGGGPVGVVIDGQNLVWIGYQNLGSTNSQGGVVQYSNPNTAAATITYITGGALPVEATRSGFRGIATDSSGNLWAASTGNLVYEYVGLATPTVTPLSLAKSIKQTGTRP